MRFASNIMVTRSRIMQCIAIMCLCVACSELDTPIPPAIQDSNQPVILDVEGWKPMTSTRAHIFENTNDILDDKGPKGGGNMTVHAYIQGNAYPFIPGSRAWYFVPDNATTGSWRFYDATKNTFFNYYWPQEGYVDFFAYMPWNGSQRMKNISVGNYISNYGLTLTCNMQSTTADEDLNTDDLTDPKGQETIFAYTTEKSKADGNVNLCFVHPFSAIYFELKQAHRDLTINWIRFNNLYLTGSTTLNATTDNGTEIEWTPTGTTKTFTIPVYKSIPGEINFGSEIGGPYLVMPQAFDHKGTPDNATDDVCITINYYWDNAKDADDVIDGDENTVPNDNVYQITRPIKSTDITEWVSGRKYTYILNLGDNKEEILFQVKVDPWDKIEYENEIEIE